MATEAGATNASSSESSVKVETCSASGYSQSSTGAKSTSEAIVTIPKQKLPLSNPLFSFASYSTIIGIGVLTDDQLNNPDTTYRAGKPFALICKSGHASPNNRVKTPYGKFDYYIDNLEISSVIGHEKGNNTNATGITFEIVEPYSMGQFTAACQQAAWEAGHKNWREAPFIITIDFKGADQQGLMTPIRGTNRQIPFKWQNISMVVKETGSTYRCEAFPYNQQALTTKNASLKTDVSVSGSTVQELLQTGSKSLQVAINKRLAQLQADGIVDVPDEVAIIFPIDRSSAGTTPSQGNSETKSSATTSTDSPTATAIYTKLGISRSADNQTLVQAESECNELGSSSMGVDQLRKGTAPVGKDNQIYSDTAKNWIRGNNTVDQTITNGAFAQDTDIPNAINQVLLSSKYAVDTLGEDRLSTDGWRKWWKIDVQVYNISPTENRGTGSKAKLIVYRVLPYKAHASTTAAANSPAPGFDEMARQAVKKYEYIYTGKNVDVLKFEILYENSFATLMAADGIKRNIEVQTQGETGGALPQTETGDVVPIVKGNAPDKGSNPTTISHTGTKTKTDHLGGPGTDTQGHRAARLFHDAINHGTDMMNLTVEILGDPYWIAQSGTGNYTSPPTQYYYLNADGTVNYQTTEVDFLMNFRSPIDLDQNVGMYNFGNSSRSVPVLEFSGVYRVTNVTSNFKGNVFTQTLSAIRRNQQESTAKPDPKKMFNVTTTPPAAQQPTPVKPTQDTSKDYLIQKGDNLTKIARANGTTIDAIMAANPQIKNRNLIYAGQTLKIPGNS